MEGSTNNQLWQAVLGELEVTLSPGTFNTWFRTTSLLELTDEQVVIGVINVFAKKQFEDRFDADIRAVLARHSVSAKDVVYKIQTVVVPSTDVGLFEQPSIRELRNKPTKQADTGGLNTKYTFDTFIVGGSNELAYAACQSIAKEPGNRYNPLFIYGDVGLGKTHLIQAVGNEIKRTRPGSTILYVSSEKFINEFVDSIRFKRKFSNRYRKADVLIVDDMQFIAGKEKTQIEFFHTFNDLHQSNKQIILSSDRPPKEIPTLEDRLRSRFEWGMTIDIHAPDLETRCAILQVKASERGTELTIDAAEFLAQRVQNNIRELEGSLNQFLAHCELQRKEPTAQTAAALFGKAAPLRKRLTAKIIVEKTASYFQIDPKLMLSPSRAREIVFPRQIAMYLLRDELDLSFPQIAESLGRKDHTTAMHSVRKIHAACQKDDQLVVQLQQLREVLHATA